MVHRPWDCMKKAINRCVLESPRHVFGDNLDVMDR